MVQISSTNEPTSAWRDARDATAHGPHLSDGWIAYRRLRGSRPSYLLVHDGERTLGVGVAYVERSRRAFWRRARCSLDRLPWCGEPTDPGASATIAAQALVDWARAQGFASLTISSFDGPSPSADFEQLGFRTEERLEFVLDLGPTEDELLAGMKGSHRRKLRKALATGLRVDLAAHSELSRIASLQQHTSTRRSERGEQMEVVDPEQLEAMRKSLLAAGDAFLLLGHLGERVVSAALVGTGSGGSYYLLGGTDAEGLRHNAATAVLWRAVTLARERGAHWFNFGGVPASAADPAAMEHGLFRFKEGWGADRRSCRSGTWTRGS